jgi:hypothetical protein
MSIGKGELDSIQNKMIRSIYESPGKQCVNLMKTIKSLTGDPAFSTDWQTHREHRVWQRQLSGVHSIMMEKLAQAGEGGGRTPIRFYYNYYHEQKCGVSSS